MDDEDTELLRSLLQSSPWDTTMQNFPVERLEPTLAWLRPSWALALVLSVVTLSGCYHPYRSPRSDEPHAVLKIRRVYETYRGMFWRENALVGDVDVLSDEGDVRDMSLQTHDTLLVQPRGFTFSIQSQFFHLENRMVDEGYTVSIPYSVTESYSCGNYRYPQTCRRLATYHRQEYRTRTVARAVEVSDGVCARRVALMPQVGHVYWLQFTYRDNQKCSLDCHEQTQSSDGHTTQRRCPVPLAER